MKLKIKKNFLSKISNNIIIKYINNICNKCNMSESHTNIIDNLSISDFRNTLENNNGLVFIKFGATWCKPCKVIKSLVNGYFSTVPENVLCYDLDVDENMDLYGYMKKNRVTHGIPVILCYVKGNLMPTRSFGDLRLKH